MTTKTLTIMEDAYNLLLENKIENESFSETIRRLLSQKKTKKITDFYGILSEEKGKQMLKDLEKIRKTNIELIKKRIK